ncbi:PREDICTED: uncharacterized protein LOC101293915 [Fragaria vesca subsp. vesca]|uniref:uncharacterized protein LOC101293915 n=1 Tax=Fragaria vesca subsp. vesca TaxID=101020 RepID=UPI0002C34F3B|nr:PREDICTED: uncharacterized protein LOC101293915 [Fragaria vesca subsp. vesca]
MKGTTPSQSAMKYPDEDNECEVKEGNGGVSVEGGFAVEGKVQSQCISLYKRDLTKRGEELTFEKNGVWRQEQKGRTARLEKQLRVRWELDEIIEEQVNRFHAHYNMDMVPNRLKDISQLLMPCWTPPDELASIGWLGDWRPSAILDLVRGLSASCFPISGSTEHLLLQLIHEIRIEEAILDEEMAEIQSKCILYLPFAPINIQSGGSALACVHSEFKKIERVITKAQQLRFKALELVLKKILNEFDAAEYLVAFEGIQDAIHQFAANQRIQKGPVAMPAKALGSA